MHHTGIAISLQVRVALEESSRFGGDVNGALMTACKMLLLSVVVAVWGTAIWGTYHIACEYNYPADDTNAALLREGGGDAAVPCGGYDSFVGSMYETLELILLGDYADIVESSVGGDYMASIIMALGMLYYAVIISDISQLLHSVDISVDNIHHKRGVLRQFMAENKVSDELRRRVDSYCTYLEEEKNGIDEMTVLYKVLTRSFKKQSPHQSET